MLYFKDKYNKIHAFEDDVNKKYIGKNLVQITEQEMIVITEPSFDEKLSNINSTIKAKMYETLKQGIKWYNSEVDDWFIITIDQSMDGFLSRTNAKLERGRVNPHNGFIFSNGKSAIINDEQMKELCLFAGCWGDQISFICQETIQKLKNGIIDPDTFNVDDIDWSIEWSGVDIDNGWDNNTLTFTQVM